MAPLLGILPIFEKNVMIRINQSTSTESKNSFFTAQLTSPVMANHLTNLLIVLFVSSERSLTLACHTSFKTGVCIQLKCASLAALFSNVMYKFNCQRDVN